MKWLMQDPSYGDMIRVELGGIYHFGIYVSDDEVIQFGLPPSSRAQMRDDEIEVLASDVDTFLAGGFLEVCLFDRKEKKQNRTPEETVQYARSQIGMRGYNILYNNCEHFANTCISGKAICDQTERIRQLIRNIPRADVYFAPLPKCDIGAPLYCKARWDYICGITNQDVKREKYFVWKLLEYALERSFGAKGTNLDFERDTSGRWYTDGYEFSLSHSGDMLAVAVSREKIGVDVELLSCPSSDKMADRILTKDEMGEYSTLAFDKRDRYIIQMWSSKEAVFKSLHDDVFRPSRITVAEHSPRCGEISHDNKVYLWSVATKNPEILRVYQNVDFI